ncbi:MAG: hypothetical protein FJ118_19220 [Deltaproteobacteria bacterium]|nr:hypothetical protein [Deltaproteobacteria bacterium]
MRHRIILAALIALIALVGVAANVQADTGSVFGPWKYFAPYYFPQSGCCLGYVLSPHDYLPKYEDPNPPVPGLPLPPACPPPMPAIKKGGPMAAHAQPAPPKPVSSEPRQIIRPGPRAAGPMDRQAGTSPRMIPTSPTQPSRPLSSQ